MNHYVSALKICRTDHENVRHWEPIDYGTNKGGTGRGKKENAATDDSTTHDED
jgi:hypothetical protein